ncbi:MAG: CoA activase [Spirochaetota bacterium]|nr:MAG: CoA activase [Spirochaetota bacterium]
MQELQRTLHVGIDAGSVSLNCIIINEHREIVYEHSYMRHLGRVEKLVIELIRDIYDKFGEGNIRSISFTGSHGQKLSEKLGVNFEFETISQILGALYLQPDARTIIYMGGQNTALYQIVHHNGNWELAHFTSNKPCASGTGSFIDQQAQRIATSLYEREVNLSQQNIDTILHDFIQLGLKSEKPAHIACRCTVFTKTDMIHLQNKGEKLEDIIYGLHVGNARNYMSSIISNCVLEEPIIFLGGLSKNEIQVKTLKDYLPALIVPRHSTSAGALGVALQAASSAEIRRGDLTELEKSSTCEDYSIPIASRLSLEKTAFAESNNDLNKRLNKSTRVYLGIDIGSTTTKYVLIDEERNIVHKDYVMTRGRPIEVSQGLFRQILQELGDRIEIIGAATTGSGRYVVGEFLNVDLIIDEITAHARGALEIDPHVDTIFEIGGQDSKYIYIENTFPLDFDMNKVCAAGTGSFLHELSNKYGINIVDEFQEIALSARSPVQMADRCTVFMESELVAFHQKGIQEDDLMAGLCYAIAYNYLNRVVGKRRIGKRLMFLGGTSLNKGVVAAFENILDRAIVVPQHREVLGAYGAAICVQEKMELENTKVSTFRGLASAVKDRMSYAEKICHSDPGCSNKCKLKIYDFEGRKSIWGGECGRYELLRVRGRKKENYFDLWQKTWLSHMQGVYAELEGKPLHQIDGRQTVGMQRSLYGLKYGVLWAHFFDQLGYRLVLSPVTNTRISTSGIEAVEVESCYPVKVSHGHIREIEGKTKWLFLPSIINLQTPKQSEVGYYCPMVQSNSYMLRMSLGVNPAAILNPVIHMKHDPDALAIELTEQLGPKLGISKSRVKCALNYALEREKEFIMEIHGKGKKIIEALPFDEPAVIVTGRPYNLHDEKINLRLGRNLAKIGITALPMDFIDVSSVDMDGFPKIYWGIGAQILKTASYLRDHSNLFGLHITNFGCGVDSFLEHFYKHVMEEKPYLILELDEHIAEAGVMTRIEAFKNVIMNAMNGRGELKRYSEKVIENGIREQDKLSVTE